MAITSMADYIQSAKQYFIFQKTAPTYAAAWVNWLGALGYPATGTYLLTDNADLQNGTIPIAGNPVGTLPLNPYTGQAYISNVEYGGASIVGSNWSSKFLIYDRLFQCGSYAANAGNNNLTNQPILQRLPLLSTGDPDYTQTQLWAESAGSGAWGGTITVTYVNQAGVAGQSTGAFVLPTSAPTMHQLPLASGDSGIQQIQSVNYTGAAATVLTNVLIIRPLKMLAVNSFFSCVKYTAELMGMVPIFPQSAINIAQMRVIASGGIVFNLYFEIASY